MVTEGSVDRVESRDSISSSFGLRLGGRGDDRAKSSGDGAGATVISPLSIRVIS